MHGIKETDAAIFKRVLALLLRLLLLELSGFFAGRQKVPDSVSWMQGMWKGDSDRPYAGCAVCANSQSDRQTPRKRNEIQQDADLGHEDSRERSRDKCMSDVWIFGISAEAFGFCGDVLESRVCREILSCVQKQAASRKNMPGETGRDRGSRKAGCHRRSHEKYLESLPELFHADFTFQRPWLSPHHVRILQTPVLLVVLNFLVKQTIKSPVSFNVQRDLRLCSV
jgi:hypothetical protein